MRRYIDRLSEFVRPIAAAVFCALIFGAAPTAQASEPWKRSDRALVIDAYEYNQIDWHALTAEKRLAAFIGKASDGLPPAYNCTGNETELRLCSALWKRYAVSRELYHTRRAMARSLGLKWGAYHLGRPGNPIDQANHFIDFTRPDPDDLIAIDIEDNDPSKWISLEDAEEFARHINRRLGRYPVLYTNGSTAKYIADNKDRYRLLSRLPLWYARYAQGVDMHFPKGNWSTYTLWQFLSQENCNTRRCPYRIPGTGFDIDINVASMSVEELKNAWPFGGLVEQSLERMVSVPLPVSREAGLSGNFTLAFADVAVTDPPLGEAESTSPALPATLTALADEPGALPDPRLAALDRLAHGIAVADEPARADPEAEIAAAEATTAPAAAPMDEIELAAVDREPAIAAAVWPGPATEMPATVSKSVRLARAYPGSVPIGEVLSRLPGGRSCAALAPLPLHVSELDDIGVPRDSPISMPSRPTLLIAAMRPVQAGTGY